jgi:DNA cross-link repair 1A protein
MASQVEAIKWVPGTKFLVDGFRFQHPDCRAYFLTHAHSDHTTGLSKSFNAGPIYCSPVTARVLRHDFGLRPDCLRVLELDETATIAGVEVTPMDANHCPGAAMFLFKVPPSSPGSKAQVILHTGDMRWQPWMAEHPALKGQQVDILILDTTYCTPRWSLPPQSEVVAAMAEHMAAAAAAEPATLFVVGSYHIGKERAYLGAAAALGWRVHCTPTKHRLLRLLGLPAEWLALLTEQPEEAQIHVLSMGEQLHEQALADRIEGTAWKRAVALKPTGWTWRQKGGLDVRDLGSVQLVGVPYSEHSSFPELR